MPNVFLISDTHFGHTNLINFKRADGSPLRPFKHVDEMNDTLIKNWNSIVSREDKVYHLGDVTMNAKSLDLLYNLNGTKILIKGNHDTQSLKYYLPHFKDIRGSHELDGLLLTHIPVSETQKYRYRGNIHGHLHDKTLRDPWYYNVSVECIDYTPIPFETLQQYYNKQRT
jgi:calcineurin-like phosphoesterase family protein